MKSSDADMIAMTTAIALHGPVMTPTARELTDALDRMGDGLMPIVVALTCNGRRSVVPISGTLKPIEPVGSDDPQAFAIVCDADAHMEVVHQIAQETARQIKRETE